MPRIANSFPVLSLYTLSLNNANPRTIFPILVCLSYLWHVFTMKPDSTTSTAMSQNRGGWCLMVGTVFRFVNLFVTGRY